MANDKIIKSRFKELIDTAKEKDLYFRDKNGCIMYGYKPNKHKLRKDRQKDIAEVLGITEQTFSNNVNGHTSPSHDTLVLLGKHYGVNPQWLIDQNAYKTELAEFAADLQNIKKDAEKNNVLINAGCNLIELHGAQFIQNEENANGMIPAAIYNGTVINSAELTQLIYKINEILGIELRYAASAAKRENERAAEQIEQTARLAGAVDFLDSMKL